MKLHSVIDIITNSSSEIFLIKNATVDDVTTLLLDCNKYMTCPFNDSIFPSDLIIDTKDNPDLKYYVSNIGRHSVEDNDVIIKKDRWLQLEDGIKRLYQKYEVYQESY